MDKCKAIRLMLSADALFGLISWPIFSLSSYHILRSIRGLNFQPRTVLDIGANIGQFSVAASKLFPESNIYAFEPVPDAFATLLKNVRSIEKVSAFQFAVGASNEVREMTLNSHRHSSSLLALGDAHTNAFPWAREENKIEVEVKTLDTVADTLKFMSPVLLKIDVQGFEAHVLRGALATLQRIDFVVLETSFQPLYVGEATFVELANLMADNGFEFVGPLDWLASPKNGEILQMDALFRRLAANNN